MTENNPAIWATLADERVFIVARVEPKADKDGVYRGALDKIPTNPHSGYDSNAQDRSTWMTGREAREHADRMNASRAAPVIEYGVGLMLADGRFCIDLDHCRETDAQGNPANGWQPHAIAFINRFPGAAVEVSTSQTGLHIFGTCSDIPLHGTRCKTYRMEAYTRERFIYLTGAGAYGDIRIDQTEALKQFLAQFFPAHEHGHAEWTDTPNVEWSGPAGDDELLERAKRSTSIKSALGKNASFAQLWEGDASVLARFYPPQMAGKSYDYSAADIALTNALAFWTGNNCARIEGLMRKSGLRRDKWDMRPNYLTDTIMRACGDAREWYHGPTNADVPAPPVLTITADESTMTVAIEPPPIPEAAPVILAPPPLHSSYSLSDMPSVGEVVAAFAQEQIFKGMCYVQDAHVIQMADGSTIGQKQFDVRMGHRKYIIENGKEPSRSAWEAFTDSQLIEFPKVQTRYFSPREATGVIREVDGRREINSYTPAVVRRVQGDASPFVRLIETLIPNANDRRIFLSWCASLVRNPGVKFMWCPFIQGTKGNGKTTIGQILTYCVSKKYTHWPKPDQIAEKFNSVFTDKLLLVCDETKTHEQRELEDTLKLLVTATDLEIRAMFTEKVMKEVCFNLLLISNHKNGVRIDKDERRYAPFYCAQQEKSDNIRDGLTTEYFINLRRWLSADGFAICYDYLMTYPISPEYDPAGQCVVAPDTTSVGEAVTASLGGVEQEILQAIEKREPGFRGGWIRDTELGHLIARIGKSKVIPRGQQKTLLASIGYIPHPALPEGLCAAPWSDGQTPRLYLSKGHPWAVDYVNPDQIREAYVSAQSQ